MNEPCVVMDSMHLDRWSTKTHPRALMIRCGEGKECQQGSLGLPWDLHGSKLKLGLPLHQVSQLVRGGLVVRVGN